MSLIGLACVVFGLGLYGVLVRRDIIAVLVSVEIMLGGPLVLLVGVGSMVGHAEKSAMSLQGIALLIIVVAAAEAAVGLSLLVALARRRSTRIDELTEVRG